jgi:type IV secretory pathway TraG/TraD family ATPase VirD4
MTLIAPTGAGKGVCLEMPNLLVGLRNMSVLNIDSAGQNAAVCAEARRRMGHETLSLNPYNLHAALYPDLADVGCNLLTALDPNSKKFFDDAMALGDASITLEGDHQVHFPNSARGLMTWLMMYDRIVEGDKANLGTVRDLLTSDLRAVAEDALKLKHPRITNLAYKYSKESKELASVISTAETQSRWLESEEMRASLSKDGIGDFGRLKDHITTLSLILPAGIESENNAPWLRMIVTCCLNAFYRRGGGGVPVLLMLSEFAQMSKLAPIRAAFGQARKYGVRVLPVLQDKNQLVETFGPQGAASFIANSACVVAMQPNDPESADWMSNFSGRKGAISVSASDDPHSGTPRITFGVQEERVWSPDKIRELPDFHGLVWKAGSSRPTSVYLPPYWEIPACRRAARPDPYHPVQNSGGMLTVVVKRLRQAVKNIFVGAVIYGVIFLILHSGLFQ